MKLNGFSNAVVTALTVVVFLAVIVTILMVSTDQVNHEELDARLARIECLLEETCG